MYILLEPWMDFERKSQCSLVSFPETAYEGKGRDCHLALQVMAKSSSKGTFVYNPLFIQLLQKSQDKVLQRSLLPFIRDFVQGCRIICNSWLMVPFSYIQP